MATPVPPPSPRHLRLLRLLLSGLILGAALNGATARRPDATTCPGSLDCALKRRAKCPPGAHACGPCLQSFQEDQRGFCGNTVGCEGVDGDHCMTSDTATAPLVQAMPRRLRVELECEEGELSFYDSERHCHLYTFHAHFGEVRPYFYLGASRGDGPPEPLRICHLRVSIKEELDI